MSRAFFPLTRPSEVRQSGHDEAGVSQPYDAPQRRCRYGCPRPDLFSNVSALVSDSAHSSIEGCSSKAILRPDHSQAPRAMAGGCGGQLRESKSGTAHEVPSTAR